MHATSLESLSDATLVSSLATLRAKQRADDVEFLWFLAEVDRRECYVPLGFASLWDFCRVELRMTGGTAGRRIHGARLLRRFPAAAPYLADGRLSLASFNRLHDLLTEENHLQPRDGGRCAFVGATGRRCNSTRHLQLHHLQAYALGGAATVENLALRCRVHNRYEAELDFGLEHMAQYRRSAAPTRGADSNLKPKTSDRSKPPLPTIRSFATGRPGGNYLT